MEPRTLHAMQVSSPQFFGKSIVVARAPLVVPPGNPSGHLATLTTRSAATNP